MDYFISLPKFNYDWLPYWQPNNSSTKCENLDCETQFGLFNRKHHCRKCGKIFCDKCWGKLMYVNTLF